MVRAVHVVISAAIVLAIWFGISFGVQHSVERAVRVDAVKKAEHWAHYMASRIPGIAELAQTGLPTDMQANVIAELRSIGDVFRFKLFNTEGQLSLIADDTSGDSYPGILQEVDSEPLQVMQTGEAIVGVFDGAGKQDRPSLYAEAYVPLVAPNGDVLAVVEVYVDQTRTAAYLMESFEKFGILLAIFCALIFISPSLAYSIQLARSKKSRQDVEFLSRFDPLTGLMNRREFVQQLKRSQSSVNPVTFLCIVELDDLKDVNDRYGYFVGDAYLAHVAESIRGSCGPLDLTARFGSDEFVIAFRSASKEQVLEKVKVVMKTCRSDFTAGGANLNGSISIGIAAFEARQRFQNAMRDAFTQADTALLHGKASGRNTFAVYGREMGEELEKRRMLELRLREATQSKDFHVFYQPLVSSQDKQITGYEALLRMMDDDGAVISPVDFIPLAEELGLIEKIGAWTIGKAIHDISILPGNAKLSVNLSPAQFKSGALPEIISQALADAQFPAGRLELEITETLLMDDSMSIHLQIDALKDMGVKFAMDDFGTGFSSLSYLWKYGFDRLKIDRSFVWAMEENPELSRKIIESIVLLCAKMDMAVTAEGVETGEQSEFLSSIGCDTLQGFLFGRPMPLVHFAGQALGNHTDLAG